MYTIIHTEKCREFAQELANRLQDSRTALVDDVLSSPEGLDDFENLGLVFENDGKSLPVSMQSFIRNVLGSCDLKGLDYMFSICLFSGGVGHALKIVEKLCAKAGCAPSLSLGLDSSSVGDAELDKAVSLIRSGDIQLAKGSLGTSIYMLIHGIRTRG